MKATFSMRPFLHAALCGLAATLPAGTAQAQLSDGKVRIGVLTDLSGAYSDISGPGAVEAAKMAIADHGGKVLGKPVELVVADHLNKADAGAAIARKWYDADGVDAIFELMASSVALATFDVAKGASKIAVATGAATSALTNAGCAPTGIHWVYDTYALASGTGRAVVAQGGDSWFFITADYAFGHALENDTAAIVKESGGKVLGAVRHPFPNTDFSSFLLQAQSSGAKIIALANGGADMTNAIRQASEFGLGQGTQKVVALLPHLSDIHSIGLQAAQGIYLTEGFYWDRTDETRAWSKRFFQARNAMPTMVQAGTYSAVAHYLKAVEAAGTDEATAVVAKMRELPIKDFFAEHASLRKDGRMVHDMYLAQVKSPAESKGPWDYYKILATIPGDQAFRPIEKSQCPLVK